MAKNNQPEEGKKMDMEKFGELVANGSFVGDGGVIPGGYTAEDECDLYGGSVSLSSLLQGIKVVKANPLDTKYLVPFGPWEQRTLWTGEQILCWFRSCLHDKINSNISGLNIKTKPKEGIIHPTLQEGIKVKNIQTTWHRLDFSSGRFVEAAFTPFLISVSGRVSYISYDGEETLIEGLTEIEREELGDLMIRRWTRFIKEG